MIQANPYKEVNFGTEKKWSHKSGSILMKFSMTGQEKCDLLIQDKENNIT
jgi:hypothetical protein